MAYSINLNNKQLNSVNESSAGYPYATFYLIKLWIKFSNSKQLHLGNESRTGYPCSTFYLIKLVKLFCRFRLLSNFELKFGELLCRSPLLDDYSELKLRKLFCRLALA